MLNFTPVGVLAVVIYLIFAIGIGKKKQIPLLQQLRGFIFFVYLLEVISITLFPIPLRHHTGNMQGNNFIPFRTILEIIAEKSVANDFRQIGGNILLFVPFGFLFPLIFKKHNRLSSIFRFGFCATLIVESSQLMLSSILGFTYRSFDVDDLICNTLGAVLGYIILRGLLNLLHQKRFRSSRIRMVASPVLLLIVSISVWGYEYGSHATPLKAEESYDSNVLPLETISFDNGVILIMNTDPSPTEQGYMAWYMTKSDFFGWHIKNKSVELLRDRLKNGMTFESLTADGKTFVWGTSGNSGAREIIYRSNGKSYTSTVDFLRFWHVIIPQSLFSRIGWTVAFQNGTTAQLLNYCGQELKKTCLPVYGILASVRVLAFFHNRA